MRLFPLFLLWIGSQALAIKALPGGWIRYVPGAPTAAAYLVLENPSPEPLRLIGAESPVAKRVSLHVSVREKQGEVEVVRMQPVPHFEIPAKGQLSLLPKGKHLMLEGLKRPLKEGEILTLTLRFSDGSSLEVKLPVEMR